MQLVQTRKAWLGGAGIVALLVVAASWFLLISPQFSDADSVRAQAQDVATSNIVLQGKIGKLHKEAQQLTTYQSQLRAALAQLPATPAIPTFTRQLTAQAQKAGITLTSITVSAPTAVAAGGAASANPAGATAPTTSTPAAGASPAAATTGGIYSSQVTLATTGSLKAQQAFVRAIQHTGPRTALVTSLQFSPGGAGSKGSSLSIDQACTMTVQLTVFDEAVSTEQAALVQKLLSAQPPK